MLAPLAELVWDGEGRHGDAVLVRPKQRVNRASRATTIHEFVKKGDF